MKFDQNNWIECPACNGTNITYRTIRIYDRDEDAGYTTKIKIDDGKVSMAEVPSQGCGNPSSRRCGVSLEFVCEGCSKDLRFEIAQHKGATAFDWCYRGQQYERSPIRGMTEAELARMATETSKW